ncbi:hypothetical protein [Erythrobacter sp.]|uniref:hypothetical protein n=1 Tax=Erythrobacter sp. TaxID=1042 RepID=UPI0025BB0647|nr:hypothetical protein [Erythrobacter sp.]
MPTYRNGHVWDAKLLDVLTIVIDPEVFPDDGELQTVCGYFRKELISMRDVCQRTDVKTLFDPKELRVRMIYLLMGYPHNSDRLIDERYGYDVSWRD